MAAIQRSDAARPVGTGTLVELALAASLHVCVPLPIVGAAIVKKKEIKKATNTDG